MATTDELIVLVKANIDQFQRGLGAVQAGLKDLNKQAVEYVNKTQRAFNIFSTTKFNNALKEASSQSKGIETLGSTIGTLINPVTVATTAVIGFGIAYADLGSKALKAAADLEASEYRMASLINLTTQFKNEAGKPLDFAENFKASLGQSRQLLEQFRKDAPQLVNIETSDLIQTAQIGLVDLGKAGISDFKKQARVIEDVTTAIQQLGAGATETQLRTEVRQFLSGDFGNATSRLGQTVSALNGGTAALKKQYAEAIRTGKAYEFFTKILNDFRIASEASADTLSNRVSVVQESFTLLLQQSGSLAMDAMRNFTNQLGQALADPAVFQAFNSLGIALSSTIQALTPYIPMLVDGFAGLANAVSGLITIGAPVVGLFGNLLDGIGKWIPGSQAAQLSAIALGAAFGGPLGAGIALALELIGELVGSIASAPANLKQTAAQFETGGNAIKNTLEQMGLSAKDAEATFEEMSGGMSDVMAKLVSDTDLSVQEIDRLFQSGTMSWWQQIKVSTAAMFSSWDNFWKIAINKTVQAVQMILAEIARLVIKAEDAINKVFDNIRSASGGLIDLGKVDIGGKQLLTNAKQAAQVAGDKASKAFADGFNKARASRVAFAPAAGADSKSLLGPEKKKKGKKGKKDSTADDRERAALLAEEAKQLEKQALQYEQIKKTNAELFAIEAKKFTLESQQKGVANKLDFAIKTREIQKQAALDELDQKEAQIALDKAKGAITEKEAQRRVAALNQERIALETKQKIEQLELQYAQQKQAIYNKNTELQLQAAEAEKESTLAVQEKIAPLLAENQTIQAKIALLTGVKGKEDEIQKLKNQEAANNQKIKKAEDEISATKEKKLLQIQTQLDLNDEEIKKLTTISNLEKEGAAARGEKIATTQAITDAADAAKSAGTNALEGLKNVASQLGEKIVGAFEDGKVSAEEFGQIALDILGQVLTQFVQVGLNALGGAMGGGGGGGGLFGFAKGGIVKAASGGYISGAGTGTSDSIPALLSNGEFVVNAASTKKFAPLLSAINTGRFSRFANGGMVGGTAPTATMGSNVMINITAMDSQDVIQALSKKDTRKYLFDTSNQATQRSSNKAFNKSPFEFTRGR